MRDLNRHARNHHSIARERFACPLSPKSTVASHYCSSLVAHSRHLRYMHPHAFAATSWGHFPSVHLGPFAHFDGCSSGRVRASPRQIAATHPARRLVEQKRATPSLIKRLYSPTALLTVVTFGIGMLLWLFDLRTSCTLSK